MQRLRGWNLELFFLIDYRVFKRLFAVITSDTKVFQKLFTRVLQLNLLENILIF